MSMDMDMATMMIYLSITMVIGLAMTTTAVTLNVATTVHMTLNLIMAIVNMDMKMTFVAGMVVMMIKIFHYI